CIFTQSCNITFPVLACSIIRAVDSTKKVTTCYNGDNVQRLSCDTGVIQVHSALYGRKDNETCSEEIPPNQLADTTCSLAGTTALVKTGCDGKRECELNPNTVRTSDPCRGISKYLQTIYSCFPAIHFATCEGSLANLQCDQGLQIRVYGADYGRRDTTTCIYKRPDAQVQNVLCSAPSPKVAERCNGKNNCIITASNSVFGDPCPGTYKYLEVAYICEYPTTNPEESL
uniref:L-rhamnose-binding lectin SML-like n=1 Tax=Gasterosteus aculeatus aculeatus TaxID=481459 RepID=UPI001A987F76